MQEPNSQQPKPDHFSSLSDKAEPVESPALPVVREAASHTPGPWNVREHHNTLQDEIGVHGLRVANVWVRKQRSGGRAESAEVEASAEGEANVRLIMAAPTMLAALQLIECNATQLADDPHESQASRGMWRCCADEARAAIARAQHGGEGVA